MASNRSDVRSVVIAPGVRVPYPVPSSDAATEIGRANGRRDTRAEVELRSALHALGMRFRKDHPVVAPGVKVRPDVVFTGQDVAVFVDGCFWHRCPEHCHIPKSNLGYWGPKLEANVARDRRVDAALIAAGWHPLHVWEHEIAAEAAVRIQSVIAARRVPAAR